MRNITRALMMCLLGIQTLSAAKAKQALVHPLLGDCVAGIAVVTFDSHDSLSILAAPAALISTIQSTPKGSCC